MFEVKNKENKNYLAKVVVVDKLKPIEGADRIQVAVVDFQDVVVSKQVEQGDLMVYFPVECAINKDFLSFTNVFRDPELNADKESKGFFEDKGRVKAIKLMKGTVKSMGYLVPSMQVAAWANYDITTKDAGVEFDTISGKLLTQKYVVKKKEAREKQGKKPQVNRLVDGQVHLHVDTENLRRNAHMIKPTDMISITYKTHGTSWWTSNVIVKRKLSWIERLLLKLGVKVQETEHDLVYGSRRVVKNQSFDDPKQKDHFFGYDLWEDIKNHVGDSIPEGFSLYGEMLGYDKNGGAIQKGYDYGCVPDGVPFGGPDDVCQSKLEVYRITFTNPDGKVFELTYPQIAEFCERAGLTPPYLFFWGKAANWLATYGQMSLNEVLEMDIRDFQEKFVSTLELAYNDKPCFMCANEVWEEGIVVRKESLFSCESYKLKSFNFLEHESRVLDSGDEDIESIN